jgi:PRTRC genetic system protein B
MRAVANLYQDSDEGFAISSAGSRPLQAKQAIVLYEAGGANKSALAVLHPVVSFGSDDEKPVLGPGSPIDRRALDTIVRQISGQKEARVREMIPAELLFADESRMVWYRPARIHPIFFRSGKTAFDLALNGKDVLWPALLFCAERSSLKVYALGSDARPQPDDAVYYAPFFNINSAGAMCAGNVRLPDMIDPSAAGRAQWEETVYMTEFTHSNYGGKRFLSHPKGHDALWQAMRWRQLWRGFPTRYLAPAPHANEERPLTVAEVIDR